MSFIMLEGSPTAHLHSISRCARPGLFNLLTQTADNLKVPGSREKGEGKKQPDSLFSRGP